MIAQLSGTLVFKSPQHLIIDVGGVGYRVFVSLNSFSDLPEVNSPVTVYTHTHMREDQLLLYGFTTQEEKNVFQKCISVSGVGPKMAMTILSGIPAQELAEAIAREDLLRLQSIPGVGKKTAERIVIELKDKFIQNKYTVAQSETQNKTNSVFNDTLSALINLGYQKPQAEKAVKAVDWEKNVKLETAIRTALKELVKK